VRWPKTEPSCNEGIVSKDAKDETDTDKGCSTSAISCAVLDCEAVTYSDEAFESLADTTPLRGLGGMVSVVVLVNSVKSEDKHISYPVSFEDMDISLSALLFRLLLTLRPNLRSTNFFPRSASDRVARIKSYQEELSR
jgi:hypothetical protein